ncbi:MAG TPA: hypothetical protein PLD48_06740, partial [Bacillota bacterium]|nr:hypothetical protein [Bacillota bacterium]
MSIFDKFLKKDNDVDDNLEFAQALFDCLKLSVGFGSEGSIQKKAKEFVKNAKDRHEVLGKVIELCQGIENPEAYYLIGTAYIWKGAKFRQQAIFYLEKFLSLSYPETNTLFRIYIDLGKAYEGEYDFYNALRYYLEAKNVNPSISPSYAHIATIYVKMNKLDEAIKFLKDAKKLPYYKPRKIVSPIDGKVSYDDTFKIVIDSYLKD